MYKLNDIATLKKLLETINGLVIQYTTMPEASADYENRIVQFVGPDGEYDTGYFYQCTNNGGYYEWNVVISGGGGTANNEPISLANVAAITTDDMGPDMFVAEISENIGVMIGRNFSMDGGEPTPNVGHSFIMTMAMGVIDTLNMELYSQYYDITDGSWTCFDDEMYVKNFDTNIVPEDATFINIDSFNYFVLPSIDIKQIVGLEDRLAEIPTTKVIRDTIATFEADTTYQDYAYRSTIYIDGMFATTIADVYFSATEMMSGNYSPVVETFDGGLYIYSKVDTEITIPAITVIGG